MRHDDVSSSAQVGQKLVQAFSKVDLHRNKHNYIRCIYIYMCVYMYTWSLLQGAKQIERGVTKQPGGVLAHHPLKETMFFFHVVSTMQFWHTTLGLVSVPFWKPCHPTAM